MPEVRMRRHSSTRSLRSPQRPGLGFGRHYLRPRSRPDLTWARLFEGAGLNTDGSPANDDERSLTFAELFAKAGIGRDGKPLHPKPIPVVTMPSAAAIARLLKTVPRSPEEKSEPNSWEPKIVGSTWQTRMINFFSQFNGILEISTEIKNALFLAFNFTFAGRIVACPKQPSNSMEDFYVQHEFIKNSNGANDGWAPRNGWKSASDDLKRAAIMYCIHAVLGHINPMDVSSKDLKTHLSALHKTLGGKRGILEFTYGSIMNV